MEDYISKFIVLSVFLFIFIVYYFLLHKNWWNIRDLLNKWIISLHLDENGKQIQVTNYSKTNGYISDTINIMQKISEKL